MILTLWLQNDGVMTWWVDASYAVHNNMKGHTGGTMSLGHGSIYSSSTKQKLVSCSSTKAELIGVYDILLLDYAPKVCKTQIVMASRLRPVRDMRPNHHE